MNKKTVHVISHTHWDREWYFTINDSTLLSAFNFKKIVEVLNNDEGFKYFHLDGQTSIIEDYLSIYPKGRDDLTKLIKEGRILIGPWYSQPDLFNINPESIIRNLVYGAQVSKKFGAKMEVCYLPDSFGLNEQMPQIAKSFGLKSIVFWRGIDFDKMVPNAVFKWESTNGDTIDAINITPGYWPLSNLNGDEEYVSNHLSPLLDLVNKRFNNDCEMVVFQGGDQAQIRENLPSEIKKINAQLEDYQLIISNLEDYSDYILNYSDENKKTYKGDLKSPKYSRVHKTIGSVRYDIKQLNSETEILLLKEIEPLSIFAEINGFELNKNIIDSCWKKLIESQAHDSVGGCNSDETNLNVLNRIKHAKEMAEGLKTIILKNIAIAKKIKNNDFIIINTNRFAGFSNPKVKIYSEQPDFQIYHGGNEVEFTIIKQSTIENGYELKHVAEGDINREVMVKKDDYYETTIQLETTIKYMDYEIYNMEISHKSKQKLKLSSDDYITNKMYKICVNDSAVSLKHEGINYPNIIYFEDVADAGDTYDFSPLKNDSPIYSELISHKVEKTEKYQKMTLVHALNLPKNLIERENLEFTKELLVLTTIELDQSVNINVTHKIENNVLDHRLRVMFDLNGIAKESIVDVPFGYAKKACHHPEPNWKDSFVENPVPIETMHNFVGVETKNSTFYVHTNGIKEHQIVNDYGSLALTLFKSVGFLGKNFLEWRPGRASGINDKLVATPDSQLQKEMVFSYAISVREGDFDDDFASKQTELFLNNEVYYQKQSFDQYFNRLERFEVPLENMNITKRKLFDFNKKLKIGAFYHSENGGYILRLINQTSQDVSIDFTSDYFANFEQIALDETPIENVHNVLKSYTLVNFRLK